MAEVFVYKALDNEIIIRKKGDGATWLGGELTPWIKEYFGENVIPAWKVHFDPEIYKSDDDAAMIVSPESAMAGNSPDRVNARTKVKMRHMNFFSLLFI